MESKYCFIFLLFSLAVLDLLIYCKALAPSYNEVETLEEIFGKLHVKDRSINESFCNSNNSNVVMKKPVEILTNFICNCTQYFCHVTSIQLKGQNLSGILPAEFADLSHLTEIDLTRNYIHDSIPPALFKLPLITLAIPDNRIRGFIPREIGELTTLEELILEGNNLQGPLPPTLGNLLNLRRLLLSSNNFTGTIPETFGNLKTLTDFRINGNEFHGKIPDFIGNWTNITKLDMQGTSMEGPIPESLSRLKNLEELRISDLTGVATTTKFPFLKEMKKLTILVLRNCRIAGPIPEYINGLIHLKILDLSSNMLTGQIPASLHKFENLTYIFLNNNYLDGAAPNRNQFESSTKMDISQNNFTDPSSFGCQDTTMNAVSSISSTNSNTSKWCLKKDLPCSTTPKYSSLFINCGGDKVNFTRDDYDEDLTPGGASYFHVSNSENWAYSSTGDFIDAKKYAEYTAKNTFSLNITGPKFYKTARVAPISLKYYGICLLKGSYNVRLYFAEIMFSNDKTFSSLGTRIFDVEIQGNVVMKNFNIAEEAKGVGKGIVKVFEAHVKGSTLEIHLYWSGKGTTSVPHRGVYGPLISAIAVTPNSNPRVGLSGGAIAGIVVSSCAFVVIVLIGLRLKGYLGGKDEVDKELRSLRLQTGYFTLRQIKAATNNFDLANKIGEGGFGPVYKGILSDGVVIAVKQLSSKSRQGNREFINEIGMISALQHPNLVKLYGCCIEGNQLLVIYDYMENNSLAHALFGHEQLPMKLDWPTRKKICIGVARGLAYLHEESRLKIVHRDIKATNVLLDKDLNAKISDFGLAKLDEEENTHISTRIAGTLGYMAPEYATRGYLTDKADVYSFGIVALEIVSGKSNTNFRHKEESVYLLDWAYVLHEHGKLLELVDPNLGSNYSEKEAMNMLNVGLLCTNLSPTLRPPMSEVVSMLEGETPIQAVLIRSDSTDNEHLRSKTRKLSHDSETLATSTSNSHILSNNLVEGCSVDISISVQNQNEGWNPSPTSRLLGDLYDVNLD